VPEYRVVVVETIRHEATFNVADQDAAKAAALGRVSMGYFDDGVSTSTQEVSSVELVR
jgi:hypothetical protein